MKIGIDARMYGPNVGGGGLGRYVEQFVNKLPEVDQENRYVLFVKNKDQKHEINAFTASENHPESDQRFRCIQTDIHWYTLKEQIALGPLIDKQNLDLVHFPHWNVPLNMKTPFVVTIHDLILLEQPKSARATTRNLLFYAIKYLAYKIVLRYTIARSKHIIAVSEYTRQSILKHFPKTNPNKITVVHEGLTSLPILPISAKELSIDPPGPYLLYVGNSYPHKNLIRLTQAFEQIIPEFPKLRLILAGRTDVFFERMERFISQSPANQYIEQIVNPTDEELSILYAGATLYVFPSLSEGFGLPPLEAMQFNVPVISSNKTSLPEILGDAAHYMNPESTKEMAAAITELLKDTQRQSELRERASTQIQKYDWKRMTQKIVSIYTHCAN